MNQCPLEVQNALFIMFDNAVCVKSGANPRHLGSFSVRFYPIPQPYLVICEHSGLLCKV